MDIAKAARGLVVVLAAGVLTACTSAGAVSGPIPTPALDAALAPTKSRQVAVVAGGCFWGIQSVYQHVRGVVEATSGYAGGEAATAHYEMVGGGDTGHAESVEVVYDPSQITYGQLLRVFFSVAHDPTQRNRQGPDYGPQYRSAIFTGDAEQDRIARAYIAQLDDAKVFASAIATVVSPLTRFYAAEDYHQNYADLHPNDMYIRINDAPKVENLQRVLPELFVKR